jgi:gliding motility-associated-like protein
LRLMKIRLVLFFLLIFSLRGYGQACNLSVTISPSQPAICAGSTIALTANATNGTGSYSYAWSTGETGKTIHVNKAINYTVTATDNTSGCTVTNTIHIDNASPPDNPTVTGGGTVCSGNSAHLVVTTPADSYQWYNDATGGSAFHNGSTYDTPPITVQTIYYVEATKNGCTGLRSAVTLNVISKPIRHNASACFGNAVTLSVTNGDNFNWYESPSATNVVHTGPSFTIPSLQKTTTYYVESVVNGCSSDRTSVTASVTPPPQQPVVGAVPAICAGSVVSLHARASSGVIDWFTQPTGGTSLISSPDYTTPALSATTTYYVQTTLNDCQSPRTKVVVQVNPVPTAPGNQTVQACSGFSAHLTAAANPTGTYQWYTDATGKHLVHTGNTYDTPPVTRPVSYYVANVSSGCMSNLSEIKVDVGSSVSAPSVVAPLTCYGSTATLVPTSPGGAYRWYAKATDTTPLFTGDNFVTPVLKNTTTYYVDATVGSCTSNRTAVKVTVLAQIADPTTRDTSTCEGTSATLTANGPDGDYAWYDSANGNNLVQTGRVFVTDPLTTTRTFYVQLSVNGCQSKLVPAKVTVKPSPSSPTLSSVPAICPGDRATLTASATGTIDWFDTEFGGQSLQRGSKYTTDPLFADKTYYVQNASGGCNSSRTPVTVTIKTTGTTFSYSSGTYAKTGANPTPTIVNPSGGVFSASPAGLVFVDNTTGKIDVSASTKGSYTVTLTSSGTCSGTYSVIVRITNSPRTNFTYNTPFCQDGSNPSPIFQSGGSPGFFTASPNGLVFGSATTGKIDLSTSKPGTYTVTNTIPASGSDPEISSTSPVTINERVVVDAGFSRSAPEGTAVRLAGTIVGGTSAGTWTGGTGKFSDVNDLNGIYTPGIGEKSATLTLTSNDPPGPCGPKSSFIIITYSPVPPAPTAKPASVCMGDSTKLSATAPGGTYNWYTVATGGSSVRTGPVFQTPALTVNTTYYVETTVNGITSSRTTVPVTINDIPVAPVAPDTVTICGAGTAILKASGSKGTYQWFAKLPNGQLQLVQIGDTYDPSPSNTTTYFVQAAIGKCVSQQKQVIVKVNPLPNITSTLFDFVCSGNPLNYTITTDIASATFLWRRARVTGISNAPVSGQTSASITETLINTTPNAIDVTYSITAMNGTCAAAPVNYVVTVYPTPVVTGTKTAAVCYGTTANYPIKFNTPSTTFSWSRALLPGISNAAISGQAADTIKEVLFNTSGAPIDVIYNINYKTSDCDGVPFNLTVTVNPQVIITSDSLSLNCSKTPQGYAITSNVAVATYSWQRDAVVGISQPAVTKTGDLIDEALTNTTKKPINVIYTITPSAYGCTSIPFTHTVTVSPKPDVPIANGNSPVCVGSVIQLRTPSVAQATYLWTGPNGYSSAAQNPDITATEALSGTYNLFVTVGGCTSDASPVKVVVNPPPVAAASGPHLVCVTATSIPLRGSISGGTTTGVWSSSNPKGKFLPSPTQVDNVQYIPSAEEKTAGKVTLTLSSTSQDDCSIDTANVEIRYGQEPGADAGPVSMNICSQETRVQLNGKVLVPGGTGFWTSSSNDGTFESGNQPNAVYIPSDADRKKGSVTLTFNVDNAGECYTPTDSIKIRLFSPPTLTTEHVRYVLKDKTITLRPTVSDEKVTYLWSPDIGISDTHIKNPVVTGDVDRTYTLIVTDSLGCVSNTDTTHVVVSPKLAVSNAFTPNGDGVNDTWQIDGLIAFENATVDVFNRYGVKVYHSLGYGVPWNGQSNGQQLPFGVYYFIIDTKVENQRFTGYVTILR